MRRFDAVLDKGGQRLGWTVVRVPFEPAEVWTTMVRRRVRGTVNGYAFRTSLFPDERGGWFVLVNARMQAGGGVGVGQKAAFTLEPDLEPRPAGLPEELDALLDEAEGMREWYGALSESMRREIGKWVEGVKGEDARQRRAEQMAERILATMDAERELPPLIAGAMKRTAGAVKGWAKMTETQRRGELFAVFYYQGVEAREKRVKKLVEGAAKRGL